jgi:hypothetical protein
MLPIMAFGTPDLHQHIERLTVMVEQLAPAGNCKNAG